MRRKRKTGTSEDTNGRVSELEAKISQSETSEISDLLMRESLAVLKEIAGHSGIRTRSKERKQDLARRITTHIENQRGYTLLRGGDSQPTR